MTIRLTGMSSGLDTQQMITDLMSSYNTQKQKKVSTVTKYSWKMDAWKALNTKINNFYSKNLSNMRFSSSYNAKKCTVSDPTKATVTAENNAVIGSQKLAVKQLAQTAYLTGGVIERKDASGNPTGKKVTKGTMLEDLGFDGEDSSMTVKTAKGTKKILLTKDTSIADLVYDLQDAGLNASFDEKNQRLFISAKKSGAANDFQLTADDESAIKAMSLAGLYSADDAKSNGEYTKWAGYKFSYDSVSGNYSYDSADEATKKLFESTLKTEAERYKKSTLNAEEYKKKAEDLKKKSEDKLNGYKDDKGEDHVGLRDQLSANTAAQAAKDKAAEALGKIDIYYDKIEDKDEEGNVTKITYKVKEDLTDEQKKEMASYGLKNEETAETLTEDVITGRVLDARKKELAAVDTSVLTDEEKKKVEDEKFAVNEAITIRKDIASAEADLKEAEEAINKADETITKNAEYFDGAGEPSEKLQQEVLKSLHNKQSTAEKVLNGDYAGSNSASRVVGQDAEIYLNGAFFTSDKNAFEINGLTVNVMDTTELTDEAKLKDPKTLTADDYKTVTLNTDTDASAVYENIKNMFKEYNALIKEMDTSYNAAVADDFDVLSDEEKDALSDKEVEEWEKKIKDSLLRRDDILNSTISMFKDAMQFTTTIDGKKYSLSSFGIETLGYFEAADNEKGVFHIDGDPDDSDTKGNDDKLKKAISTDPEVVGTFFQKLADNFYTKLQKKMAISTSSSSNTIYNDKLMKSQYETYQKKLTDFEDKLNDIEDKYYKQFTQMEVALSKVNSNTSSIQALFGMNMG